MPARRPPDPPHVALSLLTLFPGRVGGSETYVRGLIGELGDARLTLLANRHVGAEYAGRPARRVPAYRPGDSDLTRFAAMSLGRVWPRIDGREFDVVHYPLTVPVPAVRGAPWVVSLLDVQHHELPHMFSWAERRFRSWAYDGSARRADQVITISEHARTGIVEKLGIPAERVHAIHLGVDHDLFKPDGPGPEGLPARYVVYPANLWPHKNHDGLLRAWERVSDPDLHLVLSGQTYGKPAPSGPRVTHVGHIPLEDMPALLRGAQAMVFPSLFEGFGLPVLEAMACGTPVAASDRGAIAEVAGTTALLFDPEDPEAIAAAIEAVTSGSDRRAASIEHAASFTWRATAAEHMRVYGLARAGAQ
jgi:glycosyltransferase involved in cell wall biosynthesis